jgi:Mrp family chromosome partitioning ATPase/capsular polysaccharide biosynthesis protein
MWLSFGMPGPLTSPRASTTLTEFSLNEHEQQRGPVRHLQAIRAHWRLITLFVVIATTASVVLVATTPKQFEATADIIITPLSGNDDTFQGFSLFRQSFDGSSSVVTAARVFNSAETRLPAVEALRRQGLTATVKAEPLAQADIVSIRATAGTAAAAARAANVFADATVATRTAIFQRDLREQIRRLQRRVDAVPEAQRATNVAYAAIAQRLGDLQGFAGSADPTVRIAARATPPLAASWPRPMLTIGAAIIASLLLGIGIALLLELTNPSVSREEELQLGMRLPILARIPRLPTRLAHGYLMGNNQLPGASWKGYRTLRASLATAGPDGSFPRSILFTSGSPSDGKTMTAVNLAITLAAADMRVILVDADLHRPMIATIFNFGAPPEGFAGVLAERIPVGMALVQAPAHPQLKLLLSRREVVAQGRLFESTRVRRALDELHARADVVIFDAPPLVEVAEALELAAVVDAVILTVRIGHTRRDRLGELNEMIHRRGISPVGIVVTTRETSPSESPYDYQGDVVAPPSASSTVERKVVTLKER